MGNCDSMRALSINIKYSHLGSTGMSWRQQHSLFAHWMWFATGHHKALKTVPSHWTHDTSPSPDSGNISLPKACRMVEPRYDKRNAPVQVDMSSCFSLVTMRRHSQCCCLPFSLGLWNGHMWNRPEPEPQWGAKWNTAAPQPRSASWMKGNKWRLFYDTDFGDVCYAPKVRSYYL